MTDTLLIKCTETVTLFTDIPIAISVRSKTALGLLTTEHIIDTVWISRNKTTTATKLKMDLKLAR